MTIRPEIQKIADNAEKFELSTTDCFKFETKKEETNILVDIDYTFFSSILRKNHEETGLFEIELNFEESCLLFDIFHKINCRRERERAIRFKKEIEGETETKGERKKRITKNCLDYFNKLDFNNITTEK